MKLVRCAPRSVLDLPDGFDRLFDSFWRRPETVGPAAEQTWRPSVDITERDDVYEVNADLPGMT